MSQTNGEPPAADHREVAAALALLDELEERPVEEHVAVFEAAHERLRGVLADAGTAAQD